LTIAGPAVAGTLTWVFVIAPDDHLPKTISSSVTGTTSDTALTVTLSDSPSGAVTWSGQVSTNSLTFAVPRADGSIGTLTVVPGTLDAYNAALGVFQAKQAELHQAEINATAAAAAAAEQAATSCSSTVSGHDASLVVSGAARAVGECRSLVALAPSAGGPWLGPIFPSSTPLGSLVCTGTRDAYSVAIFDTGGQDYGTAACKVLRLDSTIPYMGICFQDEIVVGEGPIGIRIIPCDNGPGVVPLSPADRAGLRVGDVIIDLDGHKAPDHFTFDSIVNPHKVGDTIAVVVLRAGKKLSFSLTLGPRPWA